MVAGNSKPLAMAEASDAGPRHGDGGGGGVRVCGAMAPGGAHRTPTPRLCWDNPRSSAASNAARPMSQRVHAVETRTDTGFGIAGHGPVVGEVWRRALFSLLAHISLKTVACRQGRKCAGGGLDQTSYRNSMLRDGVACPSAKWAGVKNPCAAKLASRGSICAREAGGGRCCWVG